MTLDLDGLTEGDMAIPQEEDTNNGQTASFHIRYHQTSVRF